MKKILLLIVALLVLVGCMPTHENKATINFEKDYSGTVVLTSELDTEYLEDPISDIEEKILKVAEGLEKFETGSFKTKKEKDILIFTYSETFKDLDDLSEVLSRIYGDTVEITLEEINDIFHNKLYLEGFDFNAASFADDIYDIIEKEKIFGDDSTEIRSSREGSSYPELYLDGEYISLYENLSDDEYRHIQRDTLFIDIIDENTVNLVNIIEATDDLDLDELQAYYETNYKNRSLSEKSKSQLIIEKDEKTNSLTLSLENVNYEFIEDLQYEIFNRFIEVEVETSEELSSNDQTFVLDIYDMGHMYSFEEVVLEREVNIDIEGFEILKVDSNEYDENGVYSFHQEGPILTFEEGEFFTLLLQKENSLIISNILQYVLYGILALFAIVFIVIITVVVVRRNNNNKNHENRDNSNHVSKEVINDSSLEEGKVFKKRNDEKLAGKIQSAVFSSGSLRHAIIMFIITLITTGIFALLIELTNKGTMLSSIFENGYLSSSITFDFVTLFKVLFIWITTGGVSSTMISLEYSPLVLSSGLSIFPLLLGVIIIVVSYIISVSVFKTKSIAQRNRELLGGTLLFGLVIVGISFVPISIYDGSRSLFNLTGSLDGNTATAAFIVTPFNIILTAVLLTFKSRFNSINFEVTRVVFDGFKRFLLMFVLAAVVSTIMLFTDYSYPIVLVFNVAAMLVAVASGVSVEILEFFETEHFGLFITDQYSLFVFIGFLLVIIISVIGIQKIYRRSNIANKGRFSLVYTASLMMPVYILAAIAKMKVSADFSTTSISINYGTMILSFIVQFVVIFIAIQLIQKEHPLYEPKQVEKVTVEKEIVEQNIVQEVPVNKQRPMSGRRHRRR